MTSPAMNHDEVRELLAPLALGALTGEEHARALAHVAGCSSCQMELASLRESAGMLAHVAPPAPMTPERSARLRSRLLARAAADRGRAAAPEAAREEARVLPLRSVSREEPRSMGSSPASGPGEAAGTRPPRATPAADRASASARPAWLLAAVLALIAAGLGAFAASTGRQAAALGRQVALLEGARAQAADSAQQLAAQLGQARSVLRDLSGPNVATMALTAAGARAPWARMFWDQQSNRWTLIAHNLPVSPPGKAYELWLITKGKRAIPAGMFSAQTNGDAIYQTTYQISKDSVAVLAVTEEPAAGVPAPTGAIVIATGAGTK